VSLKHSWRPSPRHLGEKSGLGCYAAVVPPKRPKDSRRGGPEDSGARLAAQVQELVDLLDVEDEGVDSDDAIELDAEELDLVDLGDPDAAGGVLNIEYDGATYEVGDERFVIGRASDSCDLTIVDANVSRHHCAIERVDGAYLIRDLGSTNGVEIRGQKVQEHRIVDGDEIVISGHRLQCAFTAPARLQEAALPVVPVAPTAAITRRLEVSRRAEPAARPRPDPVPDSVPDPVPDPLLDPLPTVTEDEEDTFEDWVAERFDAIAYELSELRAAVDRIAAGLDDLTVEAMGRLLEGRLRQARDKRSR
jgi:hypothetical protein